MRFYTLSFLLLLSTAWWANATHNRSGEITYKHLGGNTYEITVTTFTDPASVAADRDSLIVDWGDLAGGNLDTIPRVNGNGFGEELNGAVKINIYRKNHTFPGSGCYTIKMQDLNRVNGILNINNGTSVDIPFYVESELCLFAANVWGAPNNSPIIAMNAIDTAYVNVIFEHIPIAYDPNDDSLHFEFYIPLQDDGFEVTDYTTIPTLFTGTTLTLDPNTGVLTWDSPQSPGSILNVGILITEYKRKYFPDGSLDTVLKVGSMKRDLEIFVLADNNHPPIIAIINDTCVIAGSTLNIPINVTDQNAGQTITVSANGSPFIVSESPATISVTSSGFGFWNGVFNWNTVCNHVQPDYYQVVLIAKDNYTGGPASDIEVFRIKVVAPAPENLTATPSGNSIILNWDNPYTCASATRFLGFSVWRREGPNPIVVDTCNPGLDGQGYEKIASNVQDYTYTDNDVQIGKNYCYRVLAEFGTLTSLGWVLNFVESLPSNEACSQLKRDLPVMTNVSVETTDADNGTMYVAWSNPKLADFDTIQNPGPYTYKLYRSEGFTASTNPFLVQTFSANFFYQLDDTTFTDVGLNTADSSYTYYVAFFSDTLDSLGRATPASSVYLTVNYASHELILSWEENVPWTNSSYEIYRKIPGSSTFDSLTTVTSSPYTDTGLINDSTYCYKVKSIGDYSAPGFVSPIINWSEEKCGIPKDTVGPCPPTLAVTNTCNTDNFTLGDFVNLLKWNQPAIDCGGDAIHYYIYYAASAELPLELIDSITFITDIDFEHTLNNTIEGCYAVAAVDSYYNRGPLSNVVCVENCPLYNLPNTFTPNDDGKNDVFHPVIPFRFIERVNMKIFTSWGSLVFETQIPEIGWNGINQQNNKQSPEGTYYYVCEVFEQRVGEVSKADFVLNGFIHLYR